jgi:hypothetical protein
VSFNPNHYENDIPVTCQYTILDLMYSRWGDGTLRELSRWSNGHNYVSIWHEGGDHGRGQATVKRYLVCCTTVDTMVKDVLLRGRPQWGYTEMNELLISERGEAELWTKWKQYGFSDGYGRPDEDGIPPASRWLERRRR